MKKSDRQQCSDDWKELTPKTPIVIFEQEYEGFEAAADIGRDVYEAFDSNFNPPAEALPPEFQGTITVTIHYTPPKGKS